MDDFRIRETREGDLPALREIARVCFGDEAETADLYIQDPEHIGIRPLVAEWHGKAVSAGYLIPGVTLCSPEGEKRPAVYLYALGNLPEARGKGIGMAMHRRACEKVLETGQSFCLAVLEKELKHAYEGRIPMKLLGRTREAAFTREEMPDSPGTPLERISPEEYAREREKVLRGRAHAAYAPGIWRLAGRFGYRFYRGLGILAMAETRDGGLCVASEMLAAEGGYARAAGAFAASCPAENYVIRTPAELKPEGMAREGEIREYNYCDAGCGIPAGADYWHPLILD